mmetsp:Transcript_9942/g.24485  ORF Transcript_9942/g.24485 Transcript_9942/m.24485 type:complete len:239 (-) Transcript_9942:783-1499(-)
MGLCVPRGSVHGKGRECSLGRRRRNAGPVRRAQRPQGMEGADGVHGAFDLRFPGSPGCDGCSPGRCVSGGDSSQVFPDNIRHAPVWPQAGYSPEALRRDRQGGRGQGRVYPELAQYAVVPAARHSLRRPARGGDGLYARGLVQGRRAAGLPEGRLRRHYRRAHPRREEEWRSSRWRRPRLRDHRRRRRKGHRGESEEDGRGGDEGAGSGGDSFERRCVEDCGDGAGKSEGQGRGLGGV